MNRIDKTLAAAAVALTLGACSNLNDTQERALSGGAIGAAGGAVVGALTGGSMVTGGLIGGAVGATAGALTTEEYDLD